MLTHAIVAWNNTPRQLRVAIRNPNSDKEAMLKHFLEDAHAEELPPSASEPPSLSPQFINEAEIDSDWQIFEHPILYA